MKNASKERKWIISIILVVVLYLIFYVVANRITPSTSDAYVESHAVQIAPRVSGRVVNVAVVNNQLVKKGQLLFELDPKIYQDALTRAKAMLDEAKNQISSIKSQIDAQNAIIEKSKADLDFAKRQYESYKDLVKKGFVSQIQFKAYEDQYQQRTQEYAKALADMDSIKSQLRMQDGIYAQVLKAQAAYNQANQNLEDTKVYAPFEGRVTFLRTSVGVYAPSSAPVLALIDTRNLWVIARIKENNLGRIKPGQPVEISPELYPNVVLKGQVSSIGWGVNIFPDIPPVWMPYIPKTRNWVQLAQRFPVEISVPQNDKYPMRVGSTVSVTIYTEKNGVFNFFGRMRQRIFSWLQYLY